jgi:predicted nucleic acid-binding protein
VTGKKIVVDSDVILDHLITHDTVSLLRQLMSRCFCYTTIFNAVELFASARTQKETQAIEDALYAMKVLGVNAKSSKNFAKVYLSSSDRISALIAGVCIESRLPIVTLNPARYRKIPLLKKISAHSLLKESISL